MPQIEIDQDVYNHLLTNTREIGESASSILRRLLNLDAAPGRHTGIAAPVNPAPSRIDTAARTPPLPAAAPMAPRGDPKRKSPENLARLAKATDRFLTLLSWLHSQHRDRFQRVLKLGGRQRRYFATSAKELEASGNSVNPQRINGSSYWVVTNNDTPKKLRMMEDVMEVLGLPFPVKTQWMRALRGERFTTPVSSSPQTPLPDDEDDLRI